MPDSRAPDAFPRDWGEAFAALPPETPPADGWQRLAERLPPPAKAQSRSMASWRRPALALAAALVLLAVVPFARWPTTPAVHEGAPPPATAAVQDAPASVTGSTPGDAMPSPASATQGDAPLIAVNTPAPAADTALPATMPRRAASPSRSVARTGAGAADADALDALYAESAQLEAVLSHLPEPGVADAAALALSASLQERVAGIDAALSQPRLPAGARTDLWQQRVDTLRQLTGVQTTQRWQIAYRDDGPSSDTTIY